MIMKILLSQRTTRSRAATAKERCLGLFELVFQRSAYTAAEAQPLRDIVDGPSNGGQRKDLNAHHSKPPNASRSRETMAIERVTVPIAMNSRKRTARRELR